MKIRLLLLFLLSFTFVKSEKVIVLDVDQMEEKEIPVSTFVSRIEYVPLELTKECPLNAVRGLGVTDQCTCNPTI